MSFAKLPSTFGSDVMARRVLAGLVLSLAVVGCGTTTAVSRRSAQASTLNHVDASGTESFAFQAADAAERGRIFGGLTAVTGGGTLNDSQDPIPIFPNPSPAPSLGGSVAPHPGFNPVATFRR